MAGIGQFNEATGFLQVIPFVHADTPETRKEITMPEGSAVRLDSIVVGNDGDSNVNLIVEVYDVATSAWVKVAHMTVAAYTGMGPSAAFDVLSRIAPSDQKYLVLPAGSGIGFSLYETVQVGGLVPVLVRGGVLA